MHSKNTYPEETARLPLLLLLTFLLGLGGAQTALAKGGDPIEQHLFPPELVMSNQAAIALGADQRQSLIKEIQSLQSDMVPWQLEVSESTEALTELLAASHVDEAAALALAERITGIEGRIKRRHLAALIRIKNLLSAEQQERLQALR